MRASKLDSKSEKGDKIELKGDDQTLFTGKIGRVEEVERSRVQVRVAEPLSEEVQLNFSKEKWRNILKEVWPEYSCDAAPARGAADFECKHYSYKCSLREHLVHLHSKLERRSKRNYCMYLDEQNRLQIHEAGKARGNAEVAGVLIKNGAGYRAYNPFPLLAGTSSGEGIAERLELTISNAAERLRVWWSEAEEDAGPSQHLVKGKIGELKDTYLRGSVENQSDRIIYAIISESADVKPISPGQTLDAYADGVVDLQNKVVYKMGEWSDVIFTTGYDFKFLRGPRQSLYAELKKIGLGSPDPYGPYDGEIQGGNLLFMHRENRYISPAMKQWYELAKQKEPQ